MIDRNSLYAQLLMMAENNIPPTKNHLTLSLVKAEELGKEYHANLEIVRFGICLMDIKLSEAKKNNIQSKHVKMSSDFAKEFLKKSDFSDEEKEKIINCVEAHHGDVPFYSIEAEVCANADCYRFIHPVGVFTYASVLAKRTDSLLEQVKSLQVKLEEKKKILSLPKAKAELDGYYNAYSKQFNEIIEYLEVL